MNPEFERNIWLELPARRIAMMVGVLALIFFGTSLVGGGSATTSTAEALYYFFVVFWGTRSAAMSVVGEMRARTWDMQRLSSLGAGTMVWGKLFGAAIYPWLGGAICLVLVLVGTVSHEGPAAAVIEALYFVGIGVIAQAMSLLASLVAIGRRPTYSFFETFIYQLIGFLAALLVFAIWKTIDPADSFIKHTAATDFVTWWTLRIDSRAFLIASVAIFSGWTLVGCYRAMRTELKMRNGPFVWLAFLGFMGLYVAGFDAWLSPDMKAWDAVALRLFLAGTTYAALTYIMVLLEPKDRVHYRWIWDRIRHGQIGTALWNFQAWMMSYWATFAVTAALSLWLMHDAEAARVGLPLGLATMGFVTRDVSIFVLMQTLPGKRRGDFAALVILLSLYVLIPWILNGVQATNALFVFYPDLRAPNWLGVGVAWAEGLAVAGLALTRIALTDREKAR
jgi:hypothetical protein